MPGSQDSNTGTRPAQVLLTPDDRALLQQLQDRARDRGVSIKGPTAVFRAGMKALADLPDDELGSLFADVTEKLTFDMISKHFTAWCAGVNQRVNRAVDAGDVPEDLRYAWAPSLGNSDDYGNFAWMGRFVHCSVMQDGRILISGLAAQTDPLKPGERMRFAPQLFPGGLATLLSMNDEGADLASRAIVAWLSNDERLTEQVRKDIKQHRADPLT